MKRYIVIFSLLVLAASCAQTQNPQSQNVQPQTHMITITSPAFQNEGIIPDVFSCKGQNINPKLSIAEVPNEAKSLVLIVHDPDAPVEGGFTHWVVFNIRPETKTIAQNSVPTGAVQGNNGSGKAAYTGPCPPSGTHRYYFKIYALDTELSLEQGATKDQVEKAMQGHTLDEGELMGRFSK